MEYTRSKCGCLFDGGAVWGFKSSDENGEVLRMDVKEGLREFLEKSVSTGMDKEDVKLLSEGFLAGIEWFILSQTVVK